MPKTPGKVHMYDMVKIDIIVFEIVGGAFFFLCCDNNSNDLEIGLYI